jgi:uncharacterized protein with PCYCGC motif
MKRRRRITTLTALLLPVAMIVAQGGVAPFPEAVFAAAEESSHTTLSPKDSPYHKHPPKGPLPATLDPRQYENNRVARVVYTIAAQIKDLLYQEPCFCHCRRLEGHKSLLDCYTSDHGSRCLACQREVIFSFEAHKRGQTAKQIRKAMMKDQWATVNVDEYVRSYDITSAR